MLIWLPLPLRLALAFALIVLNTLLHSLPLFTAAVLKAIAPGARARDQMSRWVVEFAERWISTNGVLLALFTRIRWQVNAADGLSPQRSYLVLCNHQSWVDILVLQQLFNRRIPFLRFFLKRELIYVPVLGLAWWALDYPFMRRYSRAELARRPELRGTDVAATRRACERFRGVPVSVMNFVEGTRFTDRKHQAQASPYRHLLRPKAGGIAFVLAALGEQLEQIVDVTIVYPGGRPTLVDLLAGRVGEIRVDIRRRAIPIDFIRGDYENDAGHRERFQRWIHGLWEEKDARIASLLEPAGVSE